ncbi:hypothetical protein SAMN04488058_101278 [Deinococcus reticulitermitis]|uniref:Uncharacterized protein n=1 Tax=Deinococcus reticulitermitis TaxID=856736 RepID=A0A1H6SE49_9DEIO|nr:hypothetical protein [Deinococcus reticulitermitis]SEI66348.1 hypothetical protein SAMN04488058_101278 [Deinococcus reticulitermitis]
MELLISALAQLGPAGVVFVLVIGLFHLGLTQFVTLLIREVQRRSRQREDRHRAAQGLPPLSETVYAPPGEFGGFAVVVVSLLIGGVLGGVMLSAVAPVIGIQAGPWAGVLAGVILAAAVSGIINYLSRRTEQRARLAGGQGDALAEVLALLASTRVTPPAPSYPDDVPLAPQPAPLRPASARDVRATQWDQDEGF